MQCGNSKEDIKTKTGQMVAVNNVSFDVNNGEICVIMGLSGSGKSTILRCLNRIIEPDAGKVILDGVDITTMGPRDLRRLRQKKIAMVFQQFALLPHRTVLQNTFYGLEVQGIEKTERMRRAEDVLAMVGLGDWADAYPDELSGGMKQRVGLARALTNDPDVLLMDEAFSALDPLIREEMQDELLSLQQRMNKTIVFVTHDFNEALKLGDQIAFLRDGSLVQLGTPEDIVSHPVDDYVAKFSKGISRTRVLTARDVMKKPHPQVLRRDGPHLALRVMQENGISSIFVVDRSRHLQGLITAESALEYVRAEITQLLDVELTQVPMVREDTMVQGILPLLAESKLPLAVVDEEQRLAGIIVRGAVLAALADEGE